MALNPALSLPYIFTNGTIIDANQVNADFATLLNATNTNSRIILSGDTTFYVAPAGIDAVGNGLDPTTPAATIGFILSLLNLNYDLGGHTATIQLANGSYTQSTSFLGSPVGCIAPSQLVIQGNTAAPNLVTVAGDPTFNGSNATRVRIQGMTLQSGVSHCIMSQHSANIQFQNIIFSTTTGAHLWAARGGTITAIGNYSINGNSANHIHAVQGGQVYLELAPGNYLSIPAGPTVTLAAGTAFGDSFCNATNLSNIKINAIFSGTATGVRSKTQFNSVINISGNGPSYLPGNAPGTDATGGITA